MGAYYVSDNYFRICKFFIPFSGLTVQEALDFMESNDTLDVRKIFIEPPDVNVNSDEDSADEEEVGLVDNLSSRQLLAGAEVVAKVAVPETHVQEENDRTEVGCEEGSPSKKPKINCSVTWVKKDITEEHAIFPEPNYTSFRGKTPIDIFEMIIDDGILEYIPNECTKYALFKNCNDPKITVEERRIFLAILYMSGYGIVPSKRSYWERQGDVRNEVAVIAMGRDRFLEICKYLHCADNNNMVENDKMWKLRPLLQRLKHKFLSLFQAEQNLDFDECM